MKFALAILVFLMFGFFLSWGTLLLIAGNPWLLICAGAVFLLTFVRVGCMSH